jgi:GT2 family glycosyltransferase
MIPSISVFIVNYNTCGLLERCLTSVFNNRGDVSVEVFVADNCSTDGSPEMVEEIFPQVSLTRHNTNMGFTKAVNPLIRQATGDFYLFLHPDVELLPDTLRAFLEFFGSNAHAGIVGANLYYPDGTPNPCEIGFPGFKNDLIFLAGRFLRRMPGSKMGIGHHNLAEWSHRATSPVNWVWNACMMVRREVIDTVGSFDENFFVWFADWDLCKRASDTGFGVYYLKDAKAIHHERRSFANGRDLEEEIRYKVDGWYSAPRQIRDRFVFLKKHATPSSIFGVKMIAVLENTLRLSVMLGNISSREAVPKEGSVQLRACLQTIQTILQA